MSSNTSFSASSGALLREDLWSLEEYSEERAEFRAMVLAHKKNRQILIGDHILLLFEDRLTLKYQIQEMLRIEKVFEAQGIQDELDAYNPLLPDGDNWKCTMLIQFPDVDERKAELQRLIGVELKVWLKIGNSEKIFPIADEDMERENGEKTSAVHFLRYQLSEQQIALAKSGAELSAGVEHPAYVTPNVTFSEAATIALYKDLT